MTAIEENVTELYQKSVKRISKPQDVAKILDTLHGFYNLEIDERDCGKPALSTHMGHYYMNSLGFPWGLRTVQLFFKG
jgi:hypothetical protein